MRETWYVLEDGNVANPSEVAADEKGVLRHKDGVAVAMRSPDVPMSRGVDIDDGEASKPAANPPKEKQAKSPSGREMKAAGAKKYKTR